jgi:hypothetical protein
MKFVLLNDKKVKEIKDFDNIDELKNYIIDENKQKFKIDLCIQIAEMDTDEKTTFCDKNQKIIQLIKFRNIDKLISKVFNRAIILFGLFALILGISFACAYQCCKYFIGDIF